MKLSIITITYNAEAVLDRTLKSVMRQRCQDFEYLIIDGNSKDNTIALAKKYDRAIVFSEPDQGIYDAMNKGLQQATGDFVWFMNAGDEIFDENTVQLIINTIAQTTDIVYGDTLFVNQDGSKQGLRSVVTPHRLPQKLSWKNFRYGMVVCHQSFVVRKSIAPAYILEHFYSADIDWEIRCLKAARVVVYINSPLSKYLTGGFSIKNLQQSLLDRFVILCRHFGVLPTLFAHVVILLRGLGMVWRKKGKYW